MNAVVLVSPVVSTMPPKSSKLNEGLPNEGTKKVLESQGKGNGGEKGMP